MCIIHYNTHLITAVSVDENCYTYIAESLKSESECKVFFFMVRYGENLIHKTDTKNTLCWLNTVLNNADGRGPAHSDAPWKE